MARRIIFLCTGNICRSPLAEVIAAEMFGGPGFEFCSAGLGAVPGLPASASSVEYATRHGLSLAGHESQPVSLALLTGAAWVIGMTRSHAAIFRSRCGAAYDGGIGILGAPGIDLAVEPQSPLAEEVLDPYGLSRENYFSCGDQITRLLGTWSDVFAVLPSDGDAAPGGSC